MEPGKVYFPWRMKAKAGTSKFQQLSSRGVSWLLFHAHPLWLFIFEATSISQNFILEMTLELIQSSSVELRRREDVKLLPEDWKKYVAFFYLLES